MPVVDSPLHTEGQSAAESPATVRIVVKSVNGHEPVKPEPMGSPTIRPMLQTPQSSPIKANSSPTKSPGRPRIVAPILTTSADFGPNAGDSSDEDSESALAVDKQVQRHSRQSKTDAMTAISGKAVGDTASQASSSSADPANHPVRKMTMTAAQSFPPLAFATATSDTAQSSIPSSASTPRHPPARLRPRLFELEEAPTFYPTAEEFSDPMRYISWVAHPEGGNGKAYGIAKIVPPEGWDPDCVIDQQTFRFRTRVQRLNSLSADARASQNYQEQLQKFHAQQGRKRVSVPVIDGRSVDLYQLKLAVASVGGYDSVSRNRKWTEISRKIGYTDAEAAHLSTQVKAAYTRVILPFEEFMSTVLAQARTISPILSQSATMPSQSHSPASKSMSPALADESVPRTPEPQISDTSEPATQSPNTRRSSRKRIDPATPTAAFRNASRRTKGTSPHGDAEATTAGAEEQMCEICLRGEDGPSMLLCDDCNRGYHMFCLQPPLTAVPKSQWFCPPCLVGTGHDFGFDDGETHSLYTFWQRAEAFKKAWWTAHADNIWKPQQEGLVNGLSRKLSGTDLVLAEDDVEREFWRLMHSQTEEVEIEYGADVHSTTHGSAMPTQETHPLDPYARDKWNLNNLPILPGSLLQYIKSDISGMTVPWIYVGMIFSTFCWHNEDHYTYSINYQHWGETKTWYGIPGDDAEKFENAMRKAAPDLFEMLPDLLFHLTTMMSPEKLRKEGVRVVACDQRANEFVITFPKAYHSGFNHGLNLNEAVNFALPDWIWDDLQSIRRYQYFRKPAVFSHDQLLITVSLQSQTIETAVWLEAPMQEMVTRETGKRQSLRDLIPGLVEEAYDEDELENKYQCTHCTMFCYLGQVTSPKSSGVACLDHAFEVCNVDAPTKWTLRLRYSDDQLRAMLGKVSEKAAVPRNWTQRLLKTLAAGANPSLKSLRSLFHEGEKIAYPLEPLDNLRDFVSSANAWVERANVFLTRKVHKRRGDGGGRRRSEAAGDATTDDVESGSDRTPDALTALLKELDALHFDAPEIAALRTVDRELNEFLLRCNQVMESETSLKDCEIVAALGTSLNVDAPQIKQLCDYVERRKWVQEVTEIGGTYLYQHEVVALLQRAESCGLTDHPLVTELQQRQSAGQEWTENARATLESKELRTVEELEKLCAGCAELAVEVEVAQDATALLAKAKELQRAMQTIQKTLASSTNPDGDLSTVSVSESDEAAVRMAMLPEARRVLRAAKMHKLQLSFADELEAAVKVHDGWRSIYDGILQKLSPLNRKLTEAEREKELALLSSRVEEATDHNDDQPRASRRSCVCRSLDMTTGSTAGCSGCHTEYHLSCIKIRSGEITRAGELWLCPICNDPAGLVKARRAVPLRDLADLVYDRRHRRDQLKFLPLEWDAVEEVVAKAMRFETAARRMEVTLSLMRRDQAKDFLAHWLRRLIGCPIDIYTVDKKRVVDVISARLTSAMVGDAASAEVERNGTLGSVLHTASGDDSMSGMGLGDSLREEALAGESSMASRSKQLGAGTAYRKRKAKRGKRAKLVFREEIGIGAYRDGMPIYCLCHEVESGRMIACDKCMLWFHTRCVCLGDPPNLGDEPWICPMCCIKAERKYPQAEVRVKAMGVTDPDVWLDIRATLRSLQDPVSKIQSWSSREDRRIVLHLEKFQPAVHAEEDSKRIKLNEDGTDGGDWDPSEVGAEAARQTVGLPPDSASEAPPEPIRDTVREATREPPGETAVERQSIVERVWETIPTRASEWPQGPVPVPHRRYNEGMDNLYRRGVTDAMLMCYYIAWNGRTLVHSLRDAYGSVVEVPIGSRIDHNEDDPTGSRVLRAAIERFNERWEQREREQATRDQTHRPSARLLQETAHPWYQKRQRYAFSPASSAGRDFVDEGSMHHRGPASQASPVPRSELASFARSGSVTAAEQYRVQEAEKRVYPEPVSSPAPDHAASMALDPALGGAEIDPALTTTAAAVPIVAADEEIERARQMARRMRPTASDSEVEEMVRAFMSA